MKISVQYLRVHFRKNEIYENSFSSLHAYRHCPVQSGPQAYLEKYYEIIGKFYVTQIFRSVNTADNEIGNKSKLIRAYFKIRIYRTSVASLYRNVCVRVRNTARHFYVYFILYIGNSKTKLTRPSLTSFAAQLILVPILIP